MSRSASKVNRPGKDFEMSSFSEPTKLDAPQSGKVPLTPSETRARKLWGTWNCPMCGEEHIKWPRKSGYNRFEDCPTYRRHYGWMGGKGHVEKDQFIPSCKLCQLERLKAEDWAAKTFEESKLVILWCGECHAEVKGKFCEPCDIYRAICGHEACPKKGEK